MAKAAVPTVSMNVVRAIFMEAIARGGDGPALCARFGIPLELLSDADARVPVATTRRLWEELPVSLGADDDFGLGVAHRAEEAGALHVLGYLLRASSNVGEALRHLLRYQRLMQDAAVPELSAGPDEVRVAWRERDPAWWMPRHAIEFGIGTVLLLTRRATGKMFCPRRVELRHPRPSNDGAARRLFGCELRYEAPLHAVVFASADMELSLTTADPLLLRILERHARELEARLPPQRSFTVEVRRVLSAALAEGATGMDEVASKLKVTRRTLQRRLQEEGTSHRRVLDELRRDLAVRLLDEGDLGIQEVAFVLGFSDQAAFHHAFVRWTGVAPGAYRGSARAGANEQRIV